MKTNSKRITTYFGMLFLATVIIHGCSDISSPYGNEDVLSANYDEAQNYGKQYEKTISSISCDSETSTELTYSPWKKYGGDISYQLTETEVVITFIPKDGWGITETHFQVTTNESELTTIPGQMPYGDEFDSAQTDPIVYTISFSDLGVSSGADFEDLYIYAHAVTGELSGGSYYGGGGSWWGKKSKKGKKGKYGKDDDDDHKWGKKGKYGKDDDDDHKWGKKGKYNKDDDDDHKWGKKGSWDKDDDDDHKDGKKYYCDRTESVWAKIHLTEFDECDPNSGGIGGTGGGNR